MTVDLRVTDTRSGARVLVIEDLPDAALLLNSVLRAAGFDAQSLGRSDWVSEVLLDEHVAVLVVSFSGRGIAATTELVAGLRARPEEPLAHAGIVALVDDETDAWFGLADAADAVLVRPVTAARFVDTVTDIAAASAAARSRRREPISDPFAAAAAQAVG